MYLIEYGESWGANTDSALWRIDYLRGNRRPSLSAHAETTVGRAPLVTKVSASASDPDGDALSYAWRIVPGDDQVVSNEATATLTFENAGVYSASVTVRDTAGLESTASVPVRVGNAPPTLRFLRPQEGDFFFYNSTLDWALQVPDHEDGDSAKEAATFGERTRLSGELLTAQELAPCKLPCANSALSLRNWRASAAPTEIGTLRLAWWIFQQRSRAKMYCSVGAVMSRA
jgi:cytochrome c